MTNKISYYEESGKIDAMRMGLSYVACVLLALLLGSIYVFCETVFPIIYLNAVVTAGFSVALGLLLLIIFRLSHNRNRRSQIIQTIVFVTLAYYFHWVAYILYAGLGHPPSVSQYLSGLGLIFSPGDFFYAIGTINYYGLWSVFGIEFKGFTLTVVWILEAAIIFTGPIILTLRRKAYPYSEIILKWYPKYTFDRNFETVVNTEPFLSQLAADPIQTIEQLDRGAAIRYVKIQLFYLPEEDQQYLTFERISIEGQGKGAKDTDIVINNFCINRSTAELLLQKFSHKRERTNVF